MPFEKTVPDEKILAQFERDDLARQAYTYSEVAEGVEELTAEAVRQRLKKMDGEEVESMKIGNTRLWHKKGVAVFANEPDGEIHTMNQMGATRIGVMALGIAAIGGIIGQTTAAATFVSLTVLGIIGVAMIAWGAAPLLSSDVITSTIAATPAGETDE